MICSKCKNEIQEGEKFCSNCGKKIKGNSSNKNSKVNKKILCIIIGIVVIIGVVVGIVLLNNKDTSNDNNIDTNVNNQVEQEDKQSEDIATESKEYYDFIDTEYCTFDFTEEEFVSRFYRNIGNGGSYQQQGYERTKATIPNQYNYARVNWDGIETMGIVCNPSNGKVRNIEIRVFKNIGENLTEENAYDIVINVVTGILGVTTDMISTDSQVKEECLQLLDELNNGISLEKGLKIKYGADTKEGVSQVVVKASVVVDTRNNQTANTDKEENIEEPTNSNNDNSNNLITENIDEPVATIEIKDYGTIKVELSYKDAPNTVKNFIALANNGFYNNLTFHRVVKDFMIQGGDKNGDGTGNATLSDINNSIKQGTRADKEYSIKGEFSKNGITNNITFEKGVIAMARADYSSYSTSITKEGYNSASSQFFITTKDNTSLNGEYAGFGKVIEGMEIIDKLNNVQVAEDNDKPITPVIITSIRVNTNDTDYGLPTTQDVFDIENYLINMYSY